MTSNEFNAAIEAEKRFTRIVGVVSLLGLAVMIALAVTIG